MAYNYFMMELIILMLFTYGNSQDAKHWQVGAKMLILRHLFTYLGGPRYIFGPKSLVLTSGVSSNIHITLMFGRHLTHEWESLAKTCVFGVFGIFCHFSGVPKGWSCTCRVEKLVLTARSYIILMLLHL